MARPRVFDEAAALSAIEDVFWRQGYEMTSYADLMAATGLGKGSLYAAFGDKQALYLKALENYIEREVGQAGALLLGSDLTAYQRIEAFLMMAVDAVAARGDRRGCFLCNAAVDLAPHDPKAQAIVSAAFNNVRAALATAAAAAPESFKKSADPDYLLSVYLGMRVMAKAGAPLGALIAARDGVLAVLRDS